MRIFAPELSHSATHVRVAVRIESERLGHAQLWFEVPAEYREYLSIEQVDGFLVGLLFPAMQYGEDIHVHGCVSETLLFKLNDYAIPLLKAFSPTSKSIRIKADATSAASLNGDGVGTGFSGGVDSFCTIYDRFELKPPSKYKVNKLLFFNVGSHGPWLEGSGSVEPERRFRQRYLQLKRFPDEAGLDYMPINSNLHFFHPWGHQKTHTLTSVAAILTLQKCFSKYYYSSTGLDYSAMLSFADGYKERDVGAYCEPVLLPLLSTESTELIADGYQYSRAQKVDRIAGYEPVRRYLNVCTSPLDGWRNCSQCQKCCRTQMTLQSIGKLNEFGQIFDIAKYRQVEWRYKRRQMCRAEHDAYAAENVRLAKENANPLPGYLASRLICATEDLGRTWAKKALYSSAIEYIRNRRARTG